MCALLFAWLCVSCVSSWRVGSLIIHDTYNARARVLSEDRHAQIHFSGISASNFIICRAAGISHTCYDPAAQAHWGHSRYVRSPWPYRNNHDSHSSQYFFTVTPEVIRTVPFSRGGVAPEGKWYSTYQCCMPRGRPRPRGRKFPSSASSRPRSLMSRPRPRPRRLCLDVSARGLSEAASNAVIFSVENESIECLFEWFLYSQCSPM